MPPSKKALAKIIELFSKSRANETRKRKEKVAKFSLELEKEISTKK